jgi:integrase
MSGNKRRGRRNDGTIESLPDGRFRAELSLGINPATGKRQRLRKYFRSYKDAKTWLRQQVAARDRGESVGVGRQTVGEWLAEWIVAVRPTIAAGTWENYESHVRKYLTPRLGKVKLGELRADRVERMYADMIDAGVSRDLVRKVATTLGVALQKAVKNHPIPFNAAHDAKKPAKDHKAVIRAFDRDQVAKFLAAAQGDRLYALYVLWLDSGARQGELFALRWGDIDWPGHAIRIVRSLEEIDGRLKVKDVKTKGSRRQVVISDVTMSALADHRKAMLAEGHYAPDATVFCDTDGGWLRKSNVNRRSFQKVLAQAGLPRFRPYDLRHTLATLLLAEGVSVKVVSERLGHSSIRQTLDTYSHVLPGMQEKAAERMGAILRSGPEDSPPVGPQTLPLASGESA